MKTKCIICLFCLATALILMHSCDDSAAPYDINTDASAYGDGSLDNPYTIEGAQLNQNAQYAWVCAYIVGYIPASDDGSYTLSDAVYTADGATTSNFVIASSAENQDINDCMAVQLPSGAIRDSLNLSDNPDNLGKQVCLYGTMERYFGSEGVKNVTAAIIDSVEIGNMPEDQDDGEALFSETFSSGLGDFTIYNVTLDEGLGSEIWTHSSSDSCACATAYSNYVDYVPAESWLVSPTIDLTEASAAALSFDHAGRYFDDISSNVTLWIANASEGDPDTNTWAQLPIPNYPDGDSRTFVSSGDIDLNAYLEQAVKIAFRYYCSANAGSYEVKNFLVEERNADEETEEDSGSSEDEPYSVAEAIAAYDADETQADTWVKGYIVGYVSSISLSESSAVFSADDAATTNIMLADETDETDYTNCLIIQLPSGDVREALNLSDNPDNLGRKVTLCGSLERYFGTYGLKSVTEYSFEDGNDNEEDTDSYDSFTQVASISSGVYLIVAQVGSTYYIAKNIRSSYSYDYLDVSSISDCGSAISGFDSDEHTFTFTLASNGSYTIQCEDGRYLYMTGSYTSFNVDDSPSSGQYFDVEPNSDGTFTITNTSTSKWMQYNSSYCSYGIYDTEKGTLPYLFLKD